MGFLSGKLRSKPQRKLSEPTYQTPEYGQQPALIPQKDQPKPTKYGPHFQKGPQQEEIYDRRANGERIPPGHPDLHNRAHTFHPPRQHPVYSDPFETRPQEWSNQMSAEHKLYHTAGDKNDPQARKNKAVSDAAYHLKVGPRHPFIPDHGPALKVAIAAAEEIRTRENLAVQGREGFVQKYPQAYKTEAALERHDTEVKKRRKSAGKKGSTHNMLKDNYAKWAIEAQRQR
ncbi:hypothetical protein N7465_001395 [Penicillium sp. CMV-2018d]|nr:hypothetical protein N7465_001395 [Penicillium sp. CMV-2018d]